MNNARVLFLSLAPNHASARRRLSDCASDDFSISAPDFGVNRVDKSIFKRLFEGDYFRVFCVLLTHRSDVVWAWGPDMCFVASIALALSRRRRLIWDISDINPRFLEDTLLSKLLLMLESALSKRADVLFLTSHAFYDNYYRRIFPEQKCVIIENKKNDTYESLSSSIRPAAPTSGPLIIVFAGIFRSTSMFEVISKVASSLKHDVKFHLHGVCDRNTDETALLQLCEHNPNVSYFGKFDNSDLANIYSTGHIVWGFVDESANLNERWLLTNRIYDAIAYRRPILANSNTFSGSTVESRSAGLSVNYDHTSIVRTINELIDNGGELYRKLAAAMPDPSEAYLFGAYEKAVRKLLGHRQKAKAPASAGQVTGPWYPRD